MVEYIVLYAAFWLSALAASVRVLHMFQLSSYQFPGYWRWLKNDGGNTALRFSPAALIALMGMGESGVWRYAAAGLFAVWAVVLFPRGKAKKPFRLTARALRIFIALALLLAGIAALAHLAGEAGNRFRMVTLASGYIGVLLLVPFASFLLTPVQKAVNNRYIRDAQRRLRPDLTVIGVTGSYGKTSTKTYIAQILSVKYNVLATPESYNTPMGVVRAIREKLEPSHTVFVCEMGARHTGDVKEICGIVHPRHGVLTAVGPQHLETFRTLENIVRTKFELVDALPPDGTAFLNAGNADIRRYAGDRAAVRYAVSDGYNEGLDIWAENLAADASGLSFDIVTRSGERERFATSLLGRHNAENVTAAVAVALKMGLTLRDVVPAVRALKPARHRLELLPKGGGLTVIDDAYNANPAGTAAALDALAVFSGVKVIVTPGMVELGEAEEAENRAFGVRIAKVCDYAALVGEKQAAPIAAGLKEAGYDGERVRIFDSFDGAYQWAVSVGAGEKVILIENDLPDNY
ncbi:MAG: UDP-N-acetylmuramoyl-tripeptide--D-alanyl-D-alanine ligase [Oscillospiraceae bacterium]|jgi:UDP-N-acetylmuramoyl-tripeptide--D-alanyl-D-alanine ligase|nr:UDP-N-acetylmuramoyl-tripeptide--D-alanyl-D-alanine ligase [Oscillospiraceae bacterium]